MMRLPVWICDLNYHRDVNVNVVFSFIPAEFGSDSSSAASESVMPRLSQFIPALHHSLVKVRANPPPELSAGVERQAREYLMGLKEGKVGKFFNHNSQISIF